MVFFLSCVARILATARRVFGVGFDVLSMMIEACPVRIARRVESSCETRVFEIFKIRFCFKTMREKNTRKTIGEVLRHHHLSAERRQKGHNKSYLMMVSADAHSPVLGVSFATDEGVLTTFKNDDDDFETRLSLLFIGFPGGERKTLSPGASSSFTSSRDVPEEENGCGGTGGYRYR